MDARWTLKSFTSNGVTGCPFGPNLQRLRSRFGGAVVLALDVIGPMREDRLAKAVNGCKRLIDEDVEAGYQVGVVPWHYDVEGSTLPQSRSVAAHSLPWSARDSGGNDVVPCLNLAHGQLMAVDVGDRVVAIFGDGDLGNRFAIQAQAAGVVAYSIRILTRGLGEGSAQELASISTGTSSPRTATSEDLADSIASMAQGHIPKD